MKDEKSSFITRRQISELYNFSRQADGCRGEGDGLNFLEEELFLRIGEKDGKPMKIKRCPWAESDELSRRYHDERWGRPVHEDNELFALLVLEGMQAGLSWVLILKREDGIRKACDDFNPQSIACWSTQKEEELMKDPSMIHNRRKIHSLITNAAAFSEVQKEWGSFDRYIWHFTDGRIIDHHLSKSEDMPAFDELSIRISADLKTRGFTFCGKTIVYSYLQAIGIINDHLEDCAFKNGNK